MKLISIGFGSTVCAERILAVIAPESAPIKRLIQEARERGMRRSDGKRNRFC